MTRAKISEYDAVASNNTDVNGVNIAEGCPPSGMNNMGREIMAALKRFQVGSDGDGVTVGGNLVVSGSSTVNTFTAGPVSATTLNTSGAVVFNDAGADVDFRVEGDTEPNLLFVDASTDRVGIGTSTPGAKIEATASGAAVQILNRTTSDGNILEIEKDGSTVGSIGNLATRMYVEGSGASGIHFGADNVIPRLSGSLNDGGVLLGTSVYRWKDLYLSGSVYLGGTAAANALDDYEEGTWTFAITTTSGSVTMDSTSDLCWYLKIGRLVSVGGQVIVDSVSSPTGAILITLPFAGADLAESAELNAGSIFVGNSVSKNARDFAMLKQSSTGLRMYIADVSVLSSAGANAQQLQAGTIIQFQLCYYASA